MCRMIAVPRGTPGSHVLEPFARMAQGMNAVNEWNETLGTWPHPDGWGGVHAFGTRDRALHSLEACWVDPQLETLADQMVVLLHARKASVGAVNLENVHPFQAEIEGANWTFCHNGTVHQQLETPCTLSKPEPTDSEIVFHRLWPYIRKGQVLVGFREVYASIRDYSGLNTFLLGPEVLWVVCLHRDTPDYFTLHLGLGPTGPIVSSEPLPELASAFEPIPNREILRIDRLNGSIDRYQL